MDRLLPAPWISAIPAYEPGLSKDEIARRHGVEKPIKLASNENPLGPSPKALAAMQKVLADTHLYPDPQALELRQAAARFFQCGMENIIAGNGSDEIIDFICRGFLKPGDKVAIPGLTFSYYAIAAQACGAEIINTDMDGMRIDVETIIASREQQPRIVFIANPNNPTGTYLNKDEVERILAAMPPSTVVVVDEAYAAFSRAKDFTSVRGYMRTHENLFVISTLSKSHGLAGMRIGFGMAGSGIMDILWRIKPPFNLNLPAIKAGAAALGDDDFLRATLQITWEGLDYLYAEFAKLGLQYVVSQTNFVLVKIGPRAGEVYEELLKRGVITRYMQRNEVKEYIRVSVGLPEENRVLIEYLHDILRK